MFWVRIFFATVLARCAFAQVPTDTEIRKILADRIDTYKQSVGIVVGVIEPQGRRVVAYGRMDGANSPSVDGDTLFEIGSITKVFTSLALSEMAQRGEVKLNDPVAKYLPANVKVPERGGKEITLIDLATHTSGLPREALNQKNAIWERDYSVDKLYEFLSSYRLTRDIGSRFEYSNLGVSLLGIALARRAGVDYEGLVQSRVIEPLGLKSTGISPTPEMNTRFSPGHTYLSNSAPHADLHVFAAAGGLRSTVHDLLTFLEAAMGYTQTRLAPAIAGMFAVHRPIDRGSQAHLGWMSNMEKGMNIVWHNGATIGYRSFLGFDPIARVGVVVLSKTGGGEGMDDIGMHLLNPKHPLLGAKELTPPKERHEARVDGKVLDAYVGSYRFAGDDVVTVTRQGGRLVLHDSDDPDDVYYPETNVSFFSRLADVQAEFKVDRQGRATEFVLHMGTKTKRYKRTK